MTQPLLDTFICIHHRDVGYLLETVLRAWEINFRPRNRLFMITNDPAHLKAFRCAGTLQDHKKRPLSGPLIGIGCLERIKPSLPTYYSKHRP